ncbi:MULTISPECIES: peroxiredoxin-like family protein [Acidiphilium]|nr:MULTISPECIES: peroxiredoxin-like family protein [Acidiphilium]EGO94328.1 Alkyl hydroperoxide reductase/ Thiol specific antioxidant/ Mal allergen [Acidiphilium sp. PM]MBS3023526.1 AhpC/TSA family protein [Acidiphilium multivorum]MBU6355135.1 AhpC/TSA family protein [Rhodospirillales bacterium]UNC14603.1 AhpC/TSA family protein [Acidiphilium multivorum]
MGLDEQLQAERDRRTADEAVRLAYEEVFTTLSTNGFLPSVLPEEATFPDFVLPDTEGRLVSLASRLARGPVLVQFFRGEWCPFCRLMLDALVGALPEIEAAGASLMALTPDIGPWAREAKRNHGATFDVLSDVDCGVGLAAGVVFRIPPIYRARLMRAGIDFADRHDNGAEFLPIPAVFLLDADGRVAWRFVNVDFTRRAAPERILSALRRLTAPERE